jgi:NADPH:quinone reductase-like Zn-dependent oxidoreductase
MNQPKGTMHAVALDQFGGPDTLTLHTLPIPEIGSTEVLIHLETAGVGEWDPFERQGGYAEMFDLKPTFPYILGSEGAGTIAAAGAEVDAFQVGDLVYAASFLNPKGGFYAEYAAVDTQFVSKIPAKLTPEQAGVMGGVGLTALRGLEDTLNLKPDETVLIFGASGGIGHMAVQLAKLMGAHVFAVASGEDGVALVERLNADQVVEGHRDNLLAAIQEFAPDGIDAALLTAGGEAAEKTVEGMRNGGRVAYPGDMDPEPQTRPNIEFMRYDGKPDADIIRRLNQWIDSGPFTVHIARTFPLEKAADAHRALDEHYLGKLALRI